MKLYIKQAVFTLGEQFTVKDEFGEDQFYVVGSFLQIPKQFRVLDKNSRQVATIERIMFRMFGQYDIVTNTDRITLKRQFSLFRQAYIIEGIDWYLQGNFTSHNYQLIRGGNPIMTLSKHWFTWGDSYELNITNEQDAILALCIAISIDYEILKDQSN